MIVVHSVGPYLGIEMCWGVDYEAPYYDPKHVSWGWLIEDLPPFRKSRWGFRFRVGSKALHVGRCDRGEDPHRHDVATIDEISEWRRPHGVQAEEAPGDTSSDEVRHLVGGGHLHGARDGSGDGDESGGSLSQGAEQASGDTVVAGGPDLDGSA